MTHNRIAAFGVSAAAAVGLSLASHGVASAAPAPRAAIPPAAATASAAQTGTYTVVSGDSLWAITQHYGIDMDALAAANHMQLSDVLAVGRTLTLPTSGTAPATPEATTSPTISHSSTSPAAETTASASSTDSTSTSGSSSLERCVISRESGGDSQVTNGSGHWGLYQFSSSTWASYGGSPSEFGHASAAAQEQVFNNAIAHGGGSNWTAYDGC